MKLSWTGYLLFIWQTYPWNSIVLELEVAYQRTLPSSGVTFHLLFTFGCGRGEVLVRHKHCTKNQKAMDVWQKLMHPLRQLLIFYCLTDRGGTEPARVGKGAFLGKDTLNPRPLCARPCPLYFLPGRRAVFLSSPLAWSGTSRTMVEGTGQTPLPDCW